MEQTLEIDYFKYSATGNILLAMDDRKDLFKTVAPGFWTERCSLNDADGIIFLGTSDKADFRMTYLNADGSEVEMCGNGLRVLAHFAHYQLKINKKEFTVETLKGVYKTSVLGKNLAMAKMVELYDIGKIDLTSFYDFKDGLYLNTGVPHCVFPVVDVDKIDVEGRGGQICHNRRFRRGSNVNFVQILRPNVIKIRTFERGVERETLSCGTGAMAAAVALSKQMGWLEKIEVHTRGGILLAEFDENFDNMFLSGAIEQVSQGAFTLTQAQEIKPSLSP